MKKKTETFKATIFMVCYWCLTCVLVYFLYFHVYTEDGYGMVTRFDAFIISSEIGYEKPAAGIFKSALGMS